MRDLSKAALTKATATIGILTLLSGLPFPAWAASPPANDSERNPTTQTSPSQTAEDYLKTGLERLEAGNPQSALGNLTHALQLNPVLTEAYCNRGVALAMLGDLDLALEDFNKTLELDKNRAEAHSRLATVYAQQGNSQLALNSFSQAIKLDSTQPDAYYNRGMLYQSN